MIRVCAHNYHSYTHLILALGIVRELTVWSFMTSECPVIHDIGLMAYEQVLSFLGAALRCVPCSGLARGFVGRTVARSLTKQHSPLFSNP